MLDIKFVRENPQIVKDALKKRNVSFDLGHLLEVDEKRRGKIKETDDLRALQNQISDVIPKLEGGERQKKIEESKELKRKLGDAEFELKALEEEFLPLLYKIPNIPLDDVPVGKDESENVALRTWGDVPLFGFPVKDHLELGKNLGIIDTEKAAEVSGTRFVYLKGDLVKLQFALVQYAFDVLGSEKILGAIGKEIQKNHPPAAFMPVAVPLMIRPDVYVKTARLGEDTKEERYRLADDDLYLIGSGEHTLVPLHMNETIAEEDLPLRYAAFSSCFRREAGSYGKDTHGILRMHQFEKIEIESFTTAENSFHEHLFFVAIQEYLMRELEIPYRVMLSATGDTDDPCAHHVDIEAWMPGQGKYRETHSADYTTDYQTRRLNTKVRRKDGGVEFAHANDATVFAMGRTLIAILENYQQEDGSVRIPEVLRKYAGGMEAIEKK